MNAETLIALIERYEFWVIVGGIFVSIGVVAESAIGIKLFRLNRELKTVERAAEQQRELKIRDSERETAVIKLELEKTKNIASGADLKAEGLNPFRQPIRTVSAFVNFKTGPHPGKIGKTESRKYEYAVMIQLGRNITQPWTVEPRTLISLVADDFKARVDTNGWSCSAECRADPTRPQIIIGDRSDLTVGEFLSGLNEGSLYPFFIAPNTSIFAGTITLTLNSSIRTVLSVPDGPIDGLGVAWQILRPPDQHNSESR